jgi:epoxyqueuosine reductase QueG
MQAQSRWHRLKGCDKCQDVVNLRKFIDGISEDNVDKLKESQQNAA